MLGRENLKTYTSCELYDRTTKKFECGEAYLKDYADKVMDDLEGQVKNLKNANAELIKRVQALEEECKELESQLPKWISVKDSLPPKHEDFIGCTIKGNVNPCWFMYPEHAIGHLSHWMPLPSAPTTEKK